MAAGFALIWLNGFRRFLHDFFFVEFSLICIFEKISKTLFHRKNLESI